MANSGKPIRKWWVADRRPLKVNVSEANTEENVEETPVEVAETPVDTVEENKIQEVETVDEVNVPQEEEKVEKKSTKKERTEEELAVLSREEFAEVEALIKAGKAKVKPRVINL